jgi:hypothetical protein
MVVKIKSTLHKYSVLCDNDSKLSLNCIDTRGRKDVCREYLFWNILEAPLLKVVFNMLIFTYLKWGQEQCTCGARL